MSSSAAFSGSTVLVSARALAVSSRKSSEMACSRVNGPARVRLSIGDMADRSKRMGDVAGEAADVGAFGDGGGEGDFINRPRELANPVRSRERGHRFDGRGRSRESES